MRGFAGRKLVAPLGVVASIAVFVVPLASAAEVSRDEYVARVEPICKTNVDANVKIFKGAKEEVKADELKKGSKHFLRAATALNKTIKQLKAVPQPSADAAKLKKWIGYLEAESSFFLRIGKALAANDKYKAQNLSVKLNRNSNLANNSVLAFGFDYCRIDSSRFS
jgi:hypothetical protein